MFRGARNRFSKDKRATIQEETDSKGAKGKGFTGWLADSTTTMKGIFAHRKPSNKNVMKEPGAKNSD